MLPLKQSDSRPSVALSDASSKSAMGNSRRHSDTPRRSAMSESTRRTDVPRKSAMTTTPSVVEPRRHWDVSKKIAGGQLGNHLGVEMGASSWAVKNEKRYQDTDEDAEEKTPFFGSRFDRKDNAWVVSLIVLVNVTVFVVAMFVNDCPRNSDGECILGSLRRFSFQPLPENPFLGPSSWTLDKMGSLRRTKITSQNQKWRLITFTWLNAGVVDLIINVSSMLFTGICLAQDFGPWKTMTIYLLSAFTGGLFSAIFLENAPAIGASSPLFGLLGAVFSGLLQNWQRYEDKLAALVAMSFLAFLHFILGMMPYVDNFANMGGLISGILLGLVFSFDSRRRYFDRKTEIHFYDEKALLKSSVPKLEKPASKIVAIVAFFLCFALVLLAVLYGVDGNNYCTWCHYLNCIPCRRWSCNEKVALCETSVSSDRVTLTCSTSGNFRIFPYTNISAARMDYLCSQICS